jgi:hypothetical protein
MFQRSVGVEHAQSGILIAYVKIAVGLGRQFPDPGAQQVRVVGRGKRVEMHPIEAVQAIRRPQPQPAIGRLRHARDMYRRAVACGPGGVVVIRKSGNMALAQSRITQYDAKQRAAQSLDPGHSRDRPVLIISLNFLS